ncbi:MAG TPA: cysteine desulfurase family protein, partial [Agromyces sp.]
MIFLDHAATTPVRREALEAMWPFLSGSFGNPSSHHALGDEASRALAAARATVAAVVGCRPGDVVFTSGGTEADNLAVKGLALANPRGRHLVVSPIEHEAVLESAAFLARVHGFEVSEVAVDEGGLVTPEALAEVIRPDTALVSVQLANNEIGTVQPVADLAAVAHAAGALVHTDAVQAAGWLPLSLDALGVDALSLAGHKVGAPKGTGALIVRGRLQLEPVLHGGGQERGRRSGTENVAGAVAFATALRLAEAERADAAARVAA